MARYEPLSRDVLLAQKQCCGKKCVNCPYVPRHVRGASVVK